MVLPHFTNVATSKYYDDTVYKNMFEVHFPDFENSEYLGKYLSENCYKVSKKCCHFNVNEVNGEILVLKTIDNLVRNKIKLNVEIFIYRKEGTILQVILLEGFRFTKIKKLILKPKVRFKYDKMKLYFDYKQYERKKKLTKLNGD